MPLTFDQALAREAAKDALSAPRGHTGGVSFGGLRAPVVMRSQGQREAAAREAVERSVRIAASPEGRFLACVIAAQQIAAKTGDEDLHAALDRAANCARRGLESGVERELAGKCLAEAELLGADVRSARQALADAAALPLAAE